MKNGAPNLREIVQTTIRNRDGYGRVYLYGAAERIVSAAEQKLRRVRRAERDDKLVDILCECVEAEEKHLERDKEFFDSVALPDWQQWAAAMVAV